ncbi:hypothetical protein [Thiolapillus sp.]|uniref:hypothetical protein n=1 Tax=Thiolapillus sp. TaxID=2017437 RepID=UPI0025D4C662|nr:hypothetical protein [Thiolapillus sp.]
MIDFGTSQSPKSTRPLTTYLCPSRPGHQALRNNFASSLLLRTWLPYDWTPRSEAYFVFPLAQGTPGKQCGLAATGVYQPSLRSPWLAAGAVGFTSRITGSALSTAGAGFFSICSGEVLFSIFLITWAVGPAGFGGVAVSSRDLSCSCSFMGRHPRSGFSDRGALTSSGILGGGTTSTGAPLSVGSGRSSPLASGSAALSSDS